MDLHRGRNFNLKIYGLYYIMSVKKVFVDTLKFATDMELKNSLSTILMLQDFFDLFFIQSIMDLHIPDT